MAKTRQDFVEEGATAARRGDTRSPGNEYTMPVFGEGNSWQAKAFAEGFAAGVARLKELVSEDAGLSEATHNADAKFAAEAGRGQSPRDAALNANRAFPFPERMPAPTREHIRQLDAMHGGEITGARIARLCKKVNQLYARWA